ncbi:MAG: restriction endonuclease subunit S [Candidatus Hydrogenedentes bacterium]|nr:restriction endonuclease subunit S [Candidatus Hydrogenedentota bacterium]
MIADLKPYPEYKESGSEWLGTVPTTWEVQNLRTLISKRTERNRADLPLLSVAREKGVFVRSMTDEKENHNVIPEDLSNYKVARAGNLVINKMKAWQGSMGIAPCDGIVSPAYFVFDLRIANHAFGQRLLRSKPYVAHFGQASDGVRVGQWDLSIPGMRQIPVLLPPPEEQAAIVRFLDWANGRLERTIRAKRKVIALLNEQKQAIIHRAVTRGLDPNVPLKPSGIPWLGDIPAHWELWRISRFARVGNGSTPSRGKPAYWNGGTYPWLNSSQVNRDMIDSADQFVTKSALRECHLPIVPAGSVLVAITGQGKTRGMSALLRIEATINQHIAFIAPRIPVASPEFICLSLRAAYLQLRALSEDSGSTKGAITCEDLKRFKLAIPPETEQTELLRVVENETRALSAAISRLEREIELLREYRTRLVADVVTGKLDVRAAAAQLPEEVTSELAEDDVELDDALETADEEAEV